MASNIIGIQGVAGSFSETAAHKFIQDYRLNNTKIAYLTSTENVLDALTQQKTNYGIFAIENAQGGVVLESIYALAAHQCHIIQLLHIPVSQNLLVRPGTRIADINAIYSHRQALRQCRNYLADNHWSCQLVEADDTAASAQRLATGELPQTGAVIANVACAALYDLEVLAADIQDLKNNLTLFAAVERLS